MAERKTMTCIGLLQLGLQLEVSFVPYMDDFTTVLNKGISPQWLKVRYISVQGPHSQSDCLFKVPASMREASILYFRTGIGED